MREQIKNILRAVPVGTRIERRKVAEQMKVSQSANGGLFRREFQSSLEELWGEGVLFCNRLGGFYERVADDDKGRAVIGKSRRYMGKGMRAVMRAQEVLRAAPVSDLDENARATHERQEARTAHAAADLAFIRRQRKFEE